MPPRHSGRLEAFVRFGPRRSRSQTGSRMPESAQRLRIDAAVCDARQFHGEGCERRYFEYVTTPLRGSLSFRSVSARGDQLAPGDGILQAEMQQAAGGSAARLMPHGRSLSSTSRIHLA